MPQLSAAAPGFRIGDHHISPPVLLAPMEDVSNLPFRLIAKRIAGPGLMFTEFVSAMAIHYKAKKTYKKLRIEPAERPLGIQIFGGEPDVMVETALLCEASGADLVDINMGCWVPKVCRTGSGAALLKDPDLAEAIVRRVVQAVKIPVTVKVRAGWDYSLFAAPDLGRRFEAAGAKMLTLHARFAKQGFDGEADWKLIGEMRKAISIPLIGNGDVKQPEDALRMLRDTGCDGVMVGRAAISNPWALRRIVEAVCGQSISPEPSLEERLDVAQEHLKLMIAYESELPMDADSIAKLPIGAPELRDAELKASRHLCGQIPMYVKGAPGAAALRERLTKCSSYAEYEAEFRAFAQSHSAGVLA